MPEPPIFTYLAGGDFRETIRLVDWAGATITTYDDAATLAGAVWAGDRTAEIFAPAFTWNDPTLGLVDVAYDGSDTDDLDDGDYPIVLAITANGVTAKAVVGLLRITAAPGSTPAPIVYCTLDEMRRHAGSLLDSLDEASDQAGFAEQREEARRWTERDILSRAAQLYDRWAKGDLLGQDWLDVIDAAADSVEDTSDSDTTKEAFLASVRGYLTDGAYSDANQLLTDEPDDRVIVEANAMYALALVYGRQFGMAGGKASDGGRSYQELAGYWRARAIAKLAAVTYRIDSTGDGSVILRLEP